MDSSSGLEILERAAEARGQILRVEADRTSGAPGMLVLTFDVGRIMIGPGERGLRIEHVGARGALPEGLESLDEAEPWWRLLGHPLTAVWPGDAAGGEGARGSGETSVLKLRFREPDANPRIVRIEARGEGVRAVLEGDSGAGRA
jgi:hypothetical protein